MKKIRTIFERDENMKTNKSNRNRCKEKQEKRNKSEGDVKDKPQDWKKAYFKVSPTGDLYIDNPLAHEVEKLIRKVRQDAIREMMKKIQEVIGEDEEYPDDFRIVAVTTAIAIKIPIDLRNALRSEQRKRLQALLK